MISGKHLFFSFFTAITLMIGCSPQRSCINNTWNIADNDTLHLETPYKGELFSSYKVSGSLFKAIDPKYIDNVYGFTEFVSANEKKTQKKFGLIAFDYSRIPNYDNQPPITSLNVRKRWNYYINENPTWFYSRILVSTLKLQAIEKIDYLASDTLTVLLARVPLSFEGRSLDGSIRVFTRNISKSTIDDRKTLYLLNNQVISRKIYEALNPVYICSLKRITDKMEIKKYEQHKNIQEIVKVELFTYEELIKNLNSRDRVSIRLIECPECEIFIVDNIQIDINIYDALNSSYFKTIRTISEDDTEAFAPFREKFPKGKLFGKKQVTVIYL